MLHSIKLPLSSSLLQNSPLREKTYNSENLGRKSLLLAIEHFSLEIQNYTVEWETCARVYFLIKLQV